MRNLKGRKILGVGKELVDFSRKIQVSSDSLTSVRNIEGSGRFKTPHREQESSLLYS